MEAERDMEERVASLHIIFFILLYNFLYSYIFMPLLPLRGQPAVAMPTLLAPQVGTDMFLQVEGCQILTRYCPFAPLYKEYDCG